jgi:hypothetical protein
MISVNGIGSCFDLENRRLTIDGFDYREFSLDGNDHDETNLSVLLKFTRALQQGEIRKDMNALELCNLEFTPEISSAIMDMFQQYSSKGVKWGSLIILEYSNPNPFLCSLLSEAQNLGLF